MTIVSVLSIAFLYVGAVFQNSVIVPEDLNGGCALEATANQTMISDSIEVVVFLSETCPICRQSTKALNRLAETFTRQGVVFTGIFPNASISTAATRSAFAKKYKLTFPLIADPDYRITDALQASITPEVFIRHIKTGKVVYQGKIDNQFETVGKRRQQITEHYVENVLISILQGREPDVKHTDPIGCFISR
jgi:peroxiredoxin